MAHDLNNILAGITSYPELLLLNLPAKSELKKPLEVIHNSGQRAAAIVSDLLTVARGIAMPKDVIEINTILRAYIDSPEFRAASGYHPSVTLVTRFYDGLLHVEGSGLHIRKSVMNLIVNAMEAVTGQDDPMVSIATQKQILKSSATGPNMIHPGEYALISIADNGGGICEEDRERIFEPFYTRKVMGRSGTGLGLTVVWNTIQDHGGHIDVHGDTRGTVFDLYFPLTRKTTTPAKDELTIEDLKGHGQRILAVDDEADQRQIISAILEKLGYQVDAVASGEQALDVLREHEADLVVLDMLMAPGMNGRQTYEHILKVRPGQKAIVVTGFSETEDVRQSLEIGAGAFIRKPYTLKDIGLAVKRVLDSQT